jgi:hypothetical protein
VIATRLVACITGKKLDRSCLRKLDPPLAGSNLPMYSYSSLDHLLKVTRGLGGQQNQTGGTLVTMMRRMSAAEASI